MTLCPLDRSLLEKPGLLGGLSYGSGSQLPHLPAGCCAWEKKYKIGIKKIRFKEVWSLFQMMLVSQDPPRSGGWG